MLFSVLIGLLLTPAALCQAIFIGVPRDYSTISAAVLAAVPGDIIVISNGTYTEHDIVITKNITLRSESGASKCIIDVAGAGRGVIIDVSSQLEVNLIGLTIKNAQIPYRSSGGALLLKSGRCRLSKSIIQGSKGAADYSSGPVSSLSESPSHLQVDNCIISNNFAANGCGIVNATVNNSWIYSNSAGNNPMALSGCISTNCTVYGNTGGFLPNPWTAGGMSGGVAVNCIFWGNSGNNSQQINRTGDSLAEYCIVQHGWPGLGNLSSDPLFVSADLGDFNLKINSPANKFPNNRSDKEIGRTNSSNNRKIILMGKR